MIRALDITSSALVAQRTRLNVIAGNMANAFTTAQEDGTIRPYRRRVVAFAPGQASGEGPGVQVAEIFEDPSGFPRRYDPGHPHALKDGPWAGYVQYPNVNLTMEYVDAMEAARAYEANVALMNVTKTMVQQAIQLFG
ncbi:MAG: flagellar basal body rod protein FlgC [Phycisphaerae bacterium]